MSNTAPATKSPTVSDSKFRSLSAIARDIKRNWPNMNYAAVPYHNAMYSLDTLSDMFYQDTAQSVVLYFLSNAATWRGEDAKRIKAELKTMLRAHGYKL
jgi:hypothetical protein